MSRWTLERFKRNHSDAGRALDHWYEFVESAGWRSFAAVRATYSTASSADGLVYFNIKGNHYRLLTDIDYDEQMVTLLRFESHAEYSKK